MKKTTKPRTSNRGIGTPLVQEYVLTRNDPLNANLRGGIPVGCFTEIYGPPESFKTTFVAEIAAEVQAMGGLVLLFDREGRLTVDRLQSVGVQTANVRYFTNEPYLLTIERVFAMAAAEIQEIRNADCERVITELSSKKPDKQMVLRYQQRFGDLAADAKELAKKLSAVNPKHGRVLFSHLLHPQDRTLVMLGIDSISAMPANTAVFGDKMPSQSEDTAEVLMRTGDLGSNSTAQEARAWSTQLKQQRFLDARVLGVATAQIRTRGFGSYTGPYQGPAVPSACEFYNRLRLNFAPNGGSSKSTVYADGDGGVYYGATANDETMGVGKRIKITVKKASGSGKFAVPAFMLNDTGTDRVNTVWEYFLDRGVFVAAGQSVSVTKNAPSTTLPGKFTRAEFVRTLYFEHLDALAALLSWSVHKYDVKAS